MKYAGACKKISPQATSVTPQIKIRKSVPQADVLVQETQPPMLEKHTLARSFVSTNDKNLITQTTFIAHIFQYVLQCVFSRFRYSLARMSNQRYKGFFCPLTIMPSSCSNRKYNISKYRLMILCWWHGNKMNNCKQGNHRSVLSWETTGPKSSSSRSSFSAISWASGSSPVFIQCT